MLRIFRTAAALLIFVQSLGFSQSITLSPDLDQRLQQTLDSLQTARGLTGLSAAFEFSDGSVWQGTAGTANASTGAAVEPEMLFSAASITKTFTASLVLQLVDEGLLTLDDPLSAWLPAYENIDSRITIRQLLGHSSGLYEYSDNPTGQLAVVLYPDTYLSPEDILDFVLAPYFAPGTDYHYSNTNYILLGMIACKALQTDSLENEYISRFFNACGLSSTFLEVEQEVPDSCCIANGYMDLNNDGVMDDMGAFPRTAIYSAAWTAGAIVSTARDLAHWGQSLFGGEVLTPALLDTMLNSRPLDAQTGSQVDYGLGVMHYTYNGQRFYGHTGHIPGYASQLVYSTDMGFSLCVLNNDHFAGLSPVIRSLTGILIDNAASVNEHDIKYTAGFELLNNYPNPFNNRTVISYRVDRNSQLSIRIFDTTGRRVATLIDEFYNAGQYETTWDGKDDNGNFVSSGIYICQMISNTGTQTNKLTLIK